MFSLCCQLSGQLNIHVGFFMLRVQIPEGRAYVFFLYQAYHLLKKKNLLKCQHVDIFQICRVFPPTKKHDRQADRQIADLVFWDTLVGSVTARIGFSVDLDLHEKSLCRIGSRWCKNNVELDLYVFVSVHFFFRSE